MKELFREVLDITTLVNKQNPIGNYIPPCLVEIDNEVEGNHLDANYVTTVDERVIKPFLELQKEALESGFHIIVDCGYRSYDYQQRLLEDGIVKMGEEKAHSLIAPPGCSEHNTGLAIDVAVIQNGIYNDDFDDTLPEIKWLHQNAHRFGFILRYPKGKEEITGYDYECWHIRFVGKELAEELYGSGLTLEEYYALKHDNPRLS